MLELFAHPFPDEGRMSHSFRLGQAFHRLALGGGVHGLDPLPLVIADFRGRKMTHTFPHTLAEVMGTYRQLEDYATRE